MASAGYAFGIMVMQPINGYLCTAQLLGGWPLSFLFNGFLGVILFFFWMYIASDSPDRHPRISQKEKDFIERYTQVNDQIRHPIPWKSIATSMPFYALLVARMTSTWVICGIMTSMPLYLSDVLNFEISQNGYISAFPWLCSFIGTLTSSYLTDWFLAQKRVSTTFIRKFNHVIGTVLPGICLVLAGYSGCNSNLAVSFISIAMLLFAFQYSGTACNHLDIAPYYAGTIVGIVNTFANLSGKIIMLTIK